MNLRVTLDPQKSEWMAIDHSVHLAYLLLLPALPVRSRRSPAHTMRWSPPAVGGQKRRERGTCASSRFTMKEKWYYSH